MGKLKKLKFFHGIKDEIKIFPDFFRRAIITSCTEIEDYSLIQKTKKNLDLFIQSPAVNAFDQAARAIQLLLASNHITGVTIQKTTHKDHYPGSKLRRIRNDI